MLTPSLIDLPFSRCGACSWCLQSLMRAPPCPGERFVLFEQFWLERGPLALPELGTDDDGAARRFVQTPSVRGQLANLARCVLARRHPILLQGPTSSGKTSLVAYLAAQTGHTFVRINNHQHTDLQEYLGSWVPDEQGALAFASLTRLPMHACTTRIARHVHALAAQTRAVAALHPYVVTCVAACSFPWRPFAFPAGRLVFREGALVTALRQGHWLVLDELNLAPTEVLEALNRCEALRRC